MFIKSISISTFSGNIGKIPKKVLYLCVVTSSRVRNEAAEEKKLF